MPTQTMLDQVATDLAVWLDQTATKIAAAMAPQGVAPFAAPLSESDKLEFYRAQLFNPDGTPNVDGRAQQVQRLGPLGFTQVYKAVIKAYPELRIPSPPAGGAPPPGTPPMPPGMPPPVPMASGGIVTQPTLALIGEAGPEMVVPLSDSSGGADASNPYWNAAPPQAQPGFQYQPVGTQGTLMHIRQEPTGTYGDPRSTIPGASSDSPAYFINQSLGAYSWSPEAANWAVRNVPIGYQASPLATTDPAMGLYRSGVGSTGQADVRLEYPIGQQPQPWQEVQTSTAHELLHGWEHQSSEQVPSVEDLDQALQELPGITPQAVEQLRQHPYYADPDHRNHLLTEIAGASVGQIPQWYRDKYLTYSRPPYPEELWGPR